MNMDQGRDDRVEAGVSVGSERARRSYHLPQIKRTALAGVIAGSAGSIPDGSWSTKPRVEGSPPGPG